MTPKSNEAYLASSTRCPFCDSDQVEGEMVDVHINAYGETGGTQQVGCLDCGAEWEDQLKLVGYRVIKTPDEPQADPRPDQQPADPPF